MAISRNEEEMLKTSILDKNFKIYYLSLQLHLLGPMSKWYSLLHTCPELYMIEEEPSQELIKLGVELQSSRGSHQPIEETF